MAEEGEVPPQGGEAAPELELLGPTEFRWEATGATSEGQYVLVDAKAPTPADGGADGEGGEEEAAAGEAAEKPKQKVMHGDGRYTIGPEVFEGEF